MTFDDLPRLPFMQRRAGTLGSAKTQRWNSVGTAPRTRARVALVAVASVVATLLSPWAGDAGATPTFSFTRYDGTDRYDTARKIAEGTYPNGAETALVASGQNFPDALVGSYLAGFKSAPILLTEKDALPAPTKTALTNLKTKNVILLGGTAAISAAVETALKGTDSAAGGGGKLAVTRIAGSDRYETAKLVGEAAPASNVGVTNNRRTALLATGINFPDALAGGPVSYSGKFPTLLTPTSNLSPHTKAAITSLGIQHVLILGGPAAVSNAVVSELSAMGVTSDRVFGADRFETAARIADLALQFLGFDNKHVNIATGTRFPDALAGGPHGGKEKSVILLTGSVPPATAKWLQDHQETLANGHIYGGPSAVSNEDATALAEAAGAFLIKLDSTTVPRGGLVQGTVASPSTVANMTASGCGINNPFLRPDATTGRFSLLVPASQALGQCTLTFQVFRNNAPPPPQTQAFTLTIVDAVQPTTAGPDLVSASITAAGQVTYVFDQPIDTSGGMPNPGNFHIYKFDGAQTNASQVTVSGNTVVARYDANLPDSTVASVEQGAVQASGGAKNPECSVALQAVSRQGGLTAAPDLIAVGGGQSFEQLGFTLDFFFDQAVGTARPEGFQLVFSDGTASSTSLGAVIDPSNQSKVAVRFSATEKTIKRAVALAGAVRGSGTSSGADNPLQSVDVGDGVTTGPDLETVFRKPSSGGKVVFDFDQAVSNPAAAKFSLFNVNGDPTTGQTDTTPTVVGDGSQVEVTFPADIAAEAVGASVEFGAVAGGQPASVAMQNVTFQAGRTSRPDLVRVRRTSSGGVTTVTFEFDEPLPFAPGNNAPREDFHLYDAAAAQTLPAANGVVSADKVSVSFSGLAGFPNPGTAVVGGVNDHTVPNPGPPGVPNVAQTVIYPEGCAAVSA